MADMIPTSFLRDIANGSIDLDTDTIDAVLLTSTYTPNAAHAKRSDLTNEVAGTGYTAGGKAISNKTVTNVGATSVFDADDTVWTVATITARYCALVKHRGGAANLDELIVILDIGATTSTAADFTVEYNATGILVFSKGP
jgi:hypothetical protein